MQGGRSAEEELQLLKQAVQCGLDALRFFDDADDNTEAAEVVALS